MRGWDNSPVTQELCVHPSRRAPSERGVWLVVGRSDRQLGDASDHCYRRISRHCRSAALLPLKPFTQLTATYSIQAAEMIKGRSIVVVTLLAVWLAIPAQACLPSSHMTATEMACCKKMAGNCNMGTGKHPCCKTVSPGPASVAMIQQIAQVHADLAVIIEAIPAHVSAPSQSASEQVALGLPPPAPPSQNSILRI
jgi:hypothetical protein